LCKAWEWCRTDFLHQNKAASPPYWGVIQPHGYLGQCGLFLTNRQSEREQPCFLQPASEILLPVIIPPTKKEFTISTVINATSKQRRQEHELKTGEADSVLAELERMHAPSFCLAEPSWVCKDLTHTPPYLFVFVRYHFAALQNGVKETFWQRAIVRKRWEKLQRKDIRQSMPVLHLKP
jgi:hypothetical protein